ncbi:MAG: ABC transporter C-terminal domain-containing protein, partial [Paracoccaceae bacterium]
EALAAAATAAGKAAPAREPAKPSKNTGLSFTERKRLDDLPALIARLEAEIVKLEEFLAVPDLYSKDPVKFKKGTAALTERQIALQTAEAEWLALIFATRGHQRPVAPPPEDEPPPKPPDGSDGSDTRERV